MDDKNLTRKEKRALKKQEKLKKQAQTKKSKTIQKFIWWSIGVVALIGFGFFIKTAFTAPDQGTVPELLVITDADQVKGATDSATLLVEYSDFQCPACAAYYTIVNQLVEEKGENFAFVYRHFPLAQHKNADEAARAAEAAGKQDKFWHMHDLLFDRQSTWAEEGNPDESFVSYAKELELDIEQFTRDYNSQEVKNKVNNDYNSGVRAGVKGTPSFYLNGEKVNPRNLDDFIQLVEPSNNQ